VNFVLNPTEIEKKSFEIISKNLEGRHFEPENLNVIKRVIHTTADFDYADNLVFTCDAVKKAIEFIKSGAPIVTDTQMARAGVNKKAAAAFGCEVHCFIDSPEAAEAARLNGYTRSRAAVDLAVEKFGNTAVFAVGNAPTALIRLYEIITAGEFSPAFIIAVPVGFVNVVESKELIMGLGVPHIVAKGKKGGSNVAAAICNALLYDASPRPQTQI